MQDSLRFVSDGTSRGVPTRAPVTPLELVEDNFTVVAASDGNGNDDMVINGGSHQELSEKVFWLVPEVFGALFDLMLRALSNTLFVKDSS